MKKLLVVLIGCILFSCNPPAKETPQLTGAYSQLSATIKGNGEDTTVVTQQLKIFTPEYMMYADFSSGDSISSFGIGPYNSEPGIIKENVIYSASDTSANSTSRTYTLEIEKTDTGFKQVIQEIGDSLKYQLTEVYERVGTEQTSPLDGAWQLTSLVNISKNDTTKEDLTNAVAYKVYYAGNFMFGNNYRDSLNVRHTGMGFGTFETVSDTKIKEMVKVTTYHEIRGKTIEVNIALNGPDEYTQTITFDNGITSIESYKRLKK